MGVLACDLAVSNPSTGIATPSHPIYSLFVLSAAIWRLKSIRLDREEQFSNHLRTMYTSFYFMYNLYKKEKWGSSSVSVL